jgi:hypothetical protein
MGRHLYWSLSGELRLRERLVHRQFVKKPCKKCGCQQEIELHFELIKSCEHTDTAILQNIDAIGALSDRMEVILVGDPCKYCGKEQEAWMRVRIKQVPQSER